MWFRCRVQRFKTPANIEVCVSQTVLSPLLRLVHIFGHHSAVRVCRTTAHTRLLISAHQHDFKDRGCYCLVAAAHPSTPHFHVQNPSHALPTPLAHMLLYG